MEYIGGSQKMKDNIVDLNIKIKQKDFDKMSEQLLTKAMQVMEQNRLLQERVDHLEELLKKVEVIEIGEKK